MKYKLWKYAKYLLPLLVATIIWLLIYINSFFKEPPGFTWYAVVWFLTNFYLLWRIGKAISIRLDSRVTWQQTFKRIVIQLVLMLIIGVITFDITFVLMNWFENNIIGYQNQLSSYHIFAISVYGSILVLFISSLQIGLTYRANWQKLLLEQHNQTHMTPKTSEEGLGDESSHSIQRFVVKKGIKTHVLLTRDIAYFEKDDLVFAITNANERFVIDHSLKELMMMIDPKYFFRISRQHIVCLNAIKEWKALKNNLIIRLDKLPNQPLKVSQRNIPEFKSWFSERYLKS